MKIQTLIPALLITVAASGCATWDNMSSREKSAATGAAVGGVAGAVISNGGVLGTVGGAAIGGVIGDQVGKNKYAAAAFLPPLSSFGASTPHAADMPRFLFRLSSPRPAPR